MMRVSVRAGLNSLWDKIKDSRDIAAIVVSSVLVAALLGLASRYG